MDDVGDLNRSMEETLDGLESTCSYLGARLEEMTTKEVFYKNHIKDLNSYIEELKSKLKKEKL